jgi:hypothetical protein
MGMSYDELDARVRRLAREQAGDSAGLKLTLDVLDLCLRVCDEVRCDHAEQSKLYHAMTDSPLATTSIAAVKEFARAEGAEHCAFKLALVHMLLESEVQRLEVSDGNTE